MEPRTHFVLVPGFGGFDALGALSYFDGVADLLRGDDRPISVCAFANLPTAGVETRAAALRRWLIDQLRRGALCPDKDDTLHLVGHSTGGLDIRVLLRTMRDDETRKDPDGDDVREILNHLRSVQFLSTPHYGTTLASYRVFAALFSGLARGSYSTLRATRQWGAGALAKAFRRLPTGKGWVQAIVDTAADFDPDSDALTRALGRASYFDALKWLHHIGDDTSALDDLIPEPFEARQREASHPVEAPRALRAIQMPVATDTYRCFEQSDPAFRSYVTVARVDPTAPYDLFAIADFLFRKRPFAGWSPRTVKLLEGGATRELSVTDHDGIVNAVSMVWPTPEASVIVEADHGDIIGHYTSTQRTTSGAASPRRRYDLLRSDAGFDAHRFQVVWRAVRDFALTHEASAR